MGLMPYVRPKYLDNNSVLANGYQLFFYIAGTTTKQDTFTDSTLGVANPNPIILNARGEPDNAGTPVDVYFTPGLSYKVVLATDTDTDPPSSPVWSVDNVTDPGGGGSSTGQWITSVTAVYVNATTFKITGVDVTGDFHQGRRVWLAGGADRYASISTSSFAIDTTVTVTNVTDSAGTASVLDPAMTGASLSLQTVTPDYGIHYRFYPGTDTGVTNYEFPIGDLRRYGAKMDDADDTAAFVSCVAAVPAGGSLLVPDGIAVVQTETITKQIHFIGTGALKLQANSDVDFLTFGVGSDGSTMKGITLDANRTAQTVEGINLTIKVADVNVEGTNQINGAEGIQVTGATASSVQILNNSFSGNSLANVTCRVDSEGISIQNNIMVGSNYGVRVLQAADVTISGNSITDFIIEGVEIAKVTTIAFDCIVTNNYISNQGVVSTGNGIAIKTSDNTIVSNNILDKIKDKAIYVDRITGGDPAAKGNNITNNIIIEPVDTGIEIGVSDHTIVTNNNVITNNVSLIGINIAGLGVGGADNLIVTNNKIGVCVTSEFLTAGGGTNVLYGENVLSTGDIRHGSMVFNGGALTIENVAYQQCLGISTSTERPRGFSFIATWPGATSISNSLSVGAYSNTNWEVIPACSKTYNTTPKVVSKTNTTCRLDFGTATPAAGFQLAVMIVKTTTEALS
jgi:hypothetical protein